MNAAAMTTNFFLKGEAPGLAPERSPAGLGRGAVPEAPVFWAVGAGLAPVPGFGGVPAGGVVPGAAAGFGASDLGGSCLAGAPAGVEGGAGIGGNPAGVPPGAGETGFPSAGRVFPGAEGAGEEPGLFGETGLSSTKLSDHACFRRFCIWNI